MENKELSIYVHYPFCVSKCPYCDFNSHVQQQVDEDLFIKSYLSELDYFKEKISGKNITSIFFGGGTPSLMNPLIADKIINKIAALAKVTENTEITLEANPSSVEVKKFHNFQKAGINRVSLGIQSFNDANLKFLGRAHSAKEAIKAIKIAAKTFSRYSIDLIYALPNQTISDLKEELEVAQNYVDKHISCYQLTIEKGTSFFDQYRKNNFSLPSESMAVEMYENVESYLKSINIEKYEISNYAQKGDECSHNLIYWKYKDYLGIGPGAHSRINNHAIMMTHKPTKWLELVKENKVGIQQNYKLEKEDLMKEYLLMNLRLVEGLNKNDFYKRFNLNLDDFLGNKKIKDLENDNLVIDDKSTFKASSAGQLVLNKIIDFLLN